MIVLIALFGFVALFATVVVLVVWPSFRKKPLRRGFDVLPPRENDDQRPAK